MINIRYAPQGLSVDKNEYKLYIGKAETNFKNVFVNYTLFIYNL